MKAQLNRPQHGGNIGFAIQQYGIPTNEWLDMSTGISPWGYPINCVSQAKSELQPKLEHLWRHLPPDSDQLIEAARKYYGAIDKVGVVTPGSQWAIKMLPQQLTPSHVAIPCIGFQEHDHSWRLANHTVHYYSRYSELHDLIATGQTQHVVVINPNNPTCDLFTHQELSVLAEQLTGIMMVDEAFGDLYAESSSLQLDHNNIVTLKSIGKFFGLAGARVGFAFGHHQIIQELGQLSEPWSIAGPSVELCTTALDDKEWQSMQRQRIARVSSRFETSLRGLANRFGVDMHGNAGLFHTLYGDRNNIDILHTRLAKSGIWTRRYNESDTTFWLRFSLPKCTQTFKQKIRHLLV